MWQKRWRKWIEEFWNMFFLKVSPIWWFLLRWTHINLQWIKVFSIESFSKKFFVIFFFWWSLTILWSLWRFFFFFSSFSYLLLKCLGIFIPIGILFFYLKSNDLKEKKSNNIIYVLSLFNFYLALRNFNETLHTISKMNCHLGILKLLTITLVLIFIYYRWRYHTLIRHSWQLLEIKEDMFVLSNVFFFYIYLAKWLMFHTTIFIYWTMTIWKVK